MDAVISAIEVMVFILCISISTVKPNEKVLILVIQGIWVVGLLLTLIQAIASSKECRRLGDIGQAKALLRYGIIGCWELLVLPVLLLLVMV